MKLLSIMKLLITVENHKYKMKSYCLKCKKDSENINSRVSNAISAKTLSLSNVENATVKNQVLLKIKKQKDY